MAEKALAIDYHTIDPTQIRILTLQHGIANDEVVCSLVSVNRDGAKYHALSYEWGVESQDDPDITVIDRQVQIRRNLFDSLKSIRKPKEDLQLWVDAICINQSDVDEKSEQVAMMGNTFSNAIGVIAWLGPANDDSDLAMDLILTPIRYGKACHPLQRTQELFLAKNFVVWCGAKSIPKYEFDESVAALNVDTGPFHQGTNFSKNPANQQRISRDARHNPRINVLRRWLWVCVSGGMECSKEHDFVYALLNISSDYEKVKGKFKIDYSKSPREVFLELLWEENLSTWRNGDGDERRWLKLAEKMNLSTDEDLGRQISSRFSRHGF